MANGSPGDRDRCRIHHDQTEQQQADRGPDQQQVDCAPAPLSSRRRSPRARRIGRATFALEQAGEGAGEPASRFHPAGDAPQRF